MGWKSIARSHNRAPTRDTYGPHNVRFLLPANDEQEGNIQAATTLKTRDATKTQETS